MDFQAGHGAVPFLPQEIAWRKDKQHFVVPQNAWFRCELRGEVARLLESEWVSDEEAG